MPTVSYYAAVSTKGVSGWLESNAIPLILLVVGIAIFGLAQRQQHRNAVRVVGTVLIALFVIGIATGGGWRTASHDLVHMVGL